MIKERAKEKSNTEITCKKFRPEQEHTHLQEFIDNLPFIIMTAVGATILLLGFIGLGLFVWGWLAAILFILYGIVGAFWIIVFVCPYCHFYDTRACPCGYGQIAAKIKPKAESEQFHLKFKKHIPVIVPLWLIPIIAGGIFLYLQFSYLMLILVIIFAIDSYILLPLVSRKYGCAHCPQRDTCPWMAGE